MPARPRRPYQSLTIAIIPSAKRPNKNGTLARRDAARWCARANVRQRPPRKERGKSACGSEQKRRTLKERSGKECVLKKSRSSPAVR